MHTLPWLCWQNFQPWVTRVFVIAFAAQEMRKRAEHKRLMLRLKPLIEKYL